MPKKLRPLLIIIFSLVSSNIILAHQSNSSDPLLIYKHTRPHLEIFRDNSLLFENEVIRISKIYPNPASEQVGFSYHLNDHQADARIILRNILGKEIATFRLESSSEKLNIPVREYVSGMYFYTLSVNGQNIITRKFLVKR